MKKIRKRTTTRGISALGVRKKTHCSERTLGLIVTKRGRDSISWVSNFRNLALGAREARKADIREIEREGSG